DTLSISRRRFVGEGMQDTLVVQNQSMKSQSFELALEVGSDFADILSVKDHDFALGDPVRAKPLPPPVEPRYEEEYNQFVLAENGDGRAQTQVFLSARGRVDGDRI